MSLLALPAVVAARSFAGAWWKAAFGAVVAAPVAFGLGQCSGAEAQKEREAASRAIAMTEALKRDAGAKEKAAGERLADAVAVTNLEEELVDAVQSQPDSKPGAVRVALGCQRLRNAGKDVSGIPACGGPEGGAEARPVR